MTLSPIVIDRNPALRRALSALPGFDAARTAAQSARTATQPRLAALLQAGDAQEALAESVQATLAAGEPLPDDLGRQALDAQQGGVMRMAERTILTRAVEQIEADVDAALSDDLTPAFRDLHEQLAAVLASVPPLAEALGTVDDPGSAIEADLGTEWKAAQRTLSGYQAIRDAQRQLCRQELRATSDQHPLDAHDLIANVLDLFPEYRQWRTVGYLVDDAAGRRTHLRPPWPADPDSWANLVWLAGSDARPWVPTPAEAGAKRTEAIPNAELREPMRYERAVTR